MGIEVANAERLMLTLRAVELLERTGETFSNAENVERLPLRGKRGYALPWTQGRPGPDRPDA